MPSLLRPEAAVRAALVHIAAMDVTLDLTDRARFVSRARIEFDSAEPGAATFVDFKGRDLVLAELNGVALPRGSWVDCRIPLPRLDAHNVLIVDGVMDYGHDGEGLHQMDDPADGRSYLYAMSFLDTAPRWFACFDQPDLKAPYRFDVTVPDGWTVWGNGPSHQVGHNRWVLEQPCPLSTYYVTLAAGPWAVVESDHGGIPLALLARQSLADDLRREADDIVTVTGQCLDAYHAMFDIRYPYGGYTQAFVPDFNAGAMENPGCVTLRDQMLLKGTPTRRERADRASVIAHEMAHQWFGDLVTMRWWDDLWLNESFAEYLGHRVASEHTQYDVWTAFGVNRKAWGAAADEGPNTHPVAGNGADDAQGALANFDGISYAKGASVLRQMATAMGETIFRRGLNAYFAAHLFGNATSDDLFQAWTDAGAAGLDGVRQAWLGTAGMDLIRAENWGNLGRIQVTPPDSGATPRRHAIEIAGLRADGSAVDQGRAVVGVGETPLPGDVEDGLVLVPDVGDITWARLRPSSWALPPLSRIARASTRVVLVNAMADAVRGGELAVADALALLVDGLPGEPDDDIVAAGLNLAVSWAQIWSVPARRAERRDAVAHLAALMLDQAGPGSDRQVICARALARVSDDTGLLTAWWQGKRLPQGLVPDDALRWALVTRIVLLGGDTGLIGRQLASDDTDRGHDAAAAAWAGAPTLAAKRAALDTLLRPSDKRVYEVYAVAAALWPAEQCDLCAPLVGEYFDGLAATASFRQGWGLTRAAECGFPMAMASPAALARAMALLADPGLDERLRRTVAERADIMRRVLRAQALEAEG